MSIAINVFYIYPIIWVLFLMLSVAHYAQDYTGITGTRFLDFWHTYQANDECLYSYVTLLSGELKAVQVRIFKVDNSSIVIGLIVVCDKQQLLLHYLYSNGYVL